MTRQNIEALFARRHEAFQRHDAIAAARLHADDGVVDSPVAGGVVQGRAGIEQVYRAFFTAFPDAVFASDELVVDGHRVVDIATIAGTDSGGFLGLPPTSKPFRMPVVFFCNVSHGEVVHERRIYDFTGLLVQIGVLKAKPA